jgi:hypothetical protein
MTPNYEMSRKKLRAYVLEHREDMDGIQALFDRPKPGREALKFPFPETEAEWQRQLNIVQPYLNTAIPNSENGPLRCYPTLG